MESGKHSSLMLESGNLEVSLSAAAKWLYVLPTGHLWACPPPLVTKFWFSLNNNSFPTLRRKASCGTLGYRDGHVIHSDTEAIKWEFSRI